MNSLTPSLVMVINDIYNNYAKPNWRDLCSVAKTLRSVVKCWNKIVIRFFFLSSNLNIISNASKKYFLFFFINRLWKNRTSLGTIEVEIFLPHFFYDGNHDEYIIIYNYSSFFQQFFFWRPLNLVIKKS